MTRPPGWGSRVCVLAFADEQLRVPTASPETTLSEHALHGCPHAAADTSFPEDRLVTRPAATLTASAGLLGPRVTAATTPLCLAVWVCVLFVVLPTDVLGFD